MIKIKKSKLIDIYIIFYLFLFIYAPPIIPIINLIIPLALYSFIVIVVKYRDLITQIINKPSIKKFLYIFILSTIYVSIVIVINMFSDQVEINNYILTYYRLFLICPVTFVCILYISVLCLKNNYSFFCLLEKITKAGMIQAFFTIAMYLMPAFRQIIITIMLKNTGNVLLKNEWYLQRRCYAFSNTIVDSFGYGSGLICAIALFLALYYKKKYFFYIPFLITVPLLNSRTGLIVFAISIIIYYLYTLFSLELSLMGKMVIYTIVFVALFWGMLTVLQNQSDIVYNWVKNGIDEMKDLILGTTTTTAGSVDHLFSKQFWYFPENISFIFGTGHNVYSVDGYLHSDVGYVNDIWLIGIVGICILYSILITPIMKYYKKMTNFKSLIVSVLVSFFVVNIKGYMLNYNAGMSVTLLIILSATYLNERRKEKWN